MVRLKIFLGIIFMAYGITANAAVYYVDQTAGSDGNNGTSPGTPWKNCPGMAAYTGGGRLAAGDTVYFDKGDVWSVSNGTQGILLVGGVTYDGETWGAGGTRAEMRAAGDQESGMVRFRDHATVATVFKGFVVDANHTVSTGVDINHAHYIVMSGATKRVQNCEVKNVSSRTSNGQYKYGIIASNHGGKDGYTENVEILNCVVHDISRDGICLYPGDENADCRIRNITVRGCESYNAGQDPEYGAGHGIVIKGYVVDAYVEYNYVHDNIGAGIFINGNERNHYPGIGISNAHIRYNIVNNNTMHGGIRIYDGSGGDPKDLKIYGNIVMNNTIKGGLSLDSAKGALSLLVYNNTFYNTFIHYRKYTATITTSEFRNNIVYYTGGTPLDASNGAITAHSNNLYYRGTGTLVTIGSTDYSSSNLGDYEITASGNDPSFKNAGNLPTGFTGTYGIDLAPNADGLSLQQRSEGVDSGISLGSPYNGSINSRNRPSGNGWDIGAYESDPGQAQDRVPNPPSNVRVL